MRTRCTKACKIKILFRILQESESLKYYDSGNGQEDRSPCNDSRASETDSHPASKADSKDYRKKGDCEDAYEQRQNLCEQSSRKRLGAPYGKGVDTGGESAYDHVAQSVEIAAFRPVGDAVAQHSGSHINKKGRAYEF